MSWVEADEVIEALVCSWGRFPQGHRYVIGGGYTIDSGGSAETSCGDVETLPGGPRLHEITTLEECRIAAKTIGVDITMMVGPGSWNHVPSGCTVLQGDATPESRAVGTSGRVHFSTTSGNNNGGKGGYLLICKQAVVTAIYSSFRVLSGVLEPILA